jgi:hypothetical protein
MNTWYPPSPETGGRGRRGVAIAAVSAAAVVLIRGGAAAVTLQAKPHGHASLKAAVLADPPSFKAAADVTPPVVAAACTTPAKFTYSGTISAAKPGTVTYEWVYSSGQPGPATTLRFTAAGDRTVTGATVTASRAGVAGARSSCSARSR